MSMIPSLISQYAGDSQLTALEVQSAEVELRNFVQHQVSYFLRPYGSLCGHGVEDCVQVILEKIRTKSPSFCQTKGSGRSWVYRVTQLHMIDLWRRANRDPLFHSLQPTKEEAFDPLSQIDGGVCVISDYEHREQLQHLSSFLEEYVEGSASRHEHVRAIVLRAEGHTWVEVLEQLGYAPEEVTEQSVNTITQAVRRLLRHLKQHLSEA